MNLRNHSGFPADMLVGSMGEFEQLGIVVCKCTYAMDARGGMAPVAAESAWPVFRQPVVVNGVTLASELEYLKRGIDILIFGDAVAPSGHHVPRMTVEVRCGAVRYAVDVVGDRRWLRAGDSFSISDPAPFTSMPLTNDRAFGGSPLADGRPFPHLSNGAGRGFVRDVGQVEGTLLPNIERPDQPIRDWRDNPRPACLFKPDGLLFDAQGPFSLQGFADAVAKGEVSARLIPRMFNQAVPELVCPEGRLGHALVLTGFDADGPVRFPLPAERSRPGRSGPFVRVAVGERRSRFPLRVVTVAAFVQQRALVITYRGLFRYLYVPEELRSAELVFAGDPYLRPPSEAQ